MAKLYIANCTKYHQVFYYRVPGKDSPNHFRLDLKPLWQDVIPHDLPPEQLEMIAQQHERYGLVADRDVPNVKGFNGLIYKIGSPVDMERVEHVQARNIEHLESEIDRRMGASAAITDHALKTQFGEDGASLNQIEIIELKDNDYNAERQRGGRRRAVMEGKKAV